MAPEIDWNSRNLHWGWLKCLRLIDPTSLAARSHSIQSWRYTAVQRHSMRTRLQSFKFYPSSCQVCSHSKETLRGLRCRKRSSRSASQKFRGLRQPSIIPGPHYRRSGNRRGCQVCSAFASAQSSRRWPSLPRLPNLRPLSLSCLFVH